MNEENLYDGFYDPTDEYNRVEPRAFCYELAIDLLRQPKLDDPNKWYEHLNTSKSILMLLFAWNYLAKQTKTLTITTMHDLLIASSSQFKLVEPYSILNIDNNYWDVIEVIFDHFRMHLGPTGASKALSILNPHLFVMWDTKIRQYLKCHYIPRIMDGRSGRDYVEYLKGIRSIIRKYDLLTKIPTGSNIAKKIDEYHYIKIVKMAHVALVTQPVYRNDRHLPHTLRGRSIFNKVIPTVCNLSNMLSKLKVYGGNYNLLDYYVKRSYINYQIDSIKDTILNATSEEEHKHIIRQHILHTDPEKLGASCIDIYLVAYIAETIHPGKRNRSPRWHRFSE